MKITNKYNLPQQFLNIANSDYKYEDDTYSATTLLKGIREIILERRHWDEIEQDISDMVWLLFGTAVHSMLDKKEEGDDELKEERITLDIDGIKLTGKFDLYNETEKCVIDYKTCSAWKFIYKDYEDWKKQLSIYAYLLKTQGFEVNKGKIIAFLKDHSKSKAKYDSNYPQTASRVVEFKITEQDISNVENELKSKLRQIKALGNVKDSELPICTKKERWAKDDTFAVMKEGRKSAIRVFDNQADAEALAITKGGYVEERKGTSAKCEDFCRVNRFCDFYKRGCK